MEILLSIFIFFICIAVVLKVGAFILKILFTLVGVIVGGSILMALFPLGLGLGLVLLVPAIIIGIVFSIIKMILFIF